MKTLDAIYKGELILQELEFDSIEPTGNGNIIYDENSMIIAIIPIDHLLIVNRNSDVELK